jgi:hypothetical protein
MSKHFRFVSNHPSELINDAILLEVECSKVGGTFCTDMELKGFPTVILVFKDKYMKYAGARTHTGMTEFLADKSNWVMDDLPVKISQFLPKIVETEVLGEDHDEL